MLPCVILIIGIEQGAQIRTQRRHSEAVFLSLEPAVRKITTEYVKWKDEIVPESPGKPPFRAPGHANRRQSL